LNSSLTYLLDTNVISEWVKPRPDPNVARWLVETDEDRIGASIISFAELHLGVESLPTGPRRDALTEWIDAELPARFEGRILGIDLHIARSWGALIHQSRKIGLNLNPIDGFFAATAHANSLTLVTRNTKHFDRLGISLENPWLERP
jgi:toxin FitB